jgi:hypothetical protein
LPATLAALAGDMERARQCLLRSAAALTSARTVLGEARERLIRLPV